MELDKTIIQYPNGLYNLEVGKFGKHDKAVKYINQANQAIEKVLQLNEAEKEKTYTIEFPNSLLSKVDSKIREKVTKELTASDIRLLTATVALAQKAKAEKRLYPLEQVNEAYFELNLSDLYEYSGLQRDKSGRYDHKQKSFIRQSLINLHFKQFFVVNSTETKDTVKIKQLIRIYEYEKDKTIKDKEKLKLTVNGILVDLEGKKASYFNLPANINRKIREINKGRQNVSIELFVKTMFQAKHFAKEAETEFTENKLVEILKLTRYKESRHHGRIKTTLEKAFYTAKELGIIKGHSITNDKWGNTKYVFKLA